MGKKGEKSGPIQPGEAGRLINWVEGYLGLDPSDEVPQGSVTSPSKEPRRWYKVGKGWLADGDFPSGRHT